MSRYHLEKLTLPELQEEAKSYGLSVIPEDWNKCIDAIMSHLERYGPWSDGRNVLNKDVPEVPNLPIPKSTAGLNHDLTDPSLKNPSSSGIDQSSSVSTETIISHFCSVMTQQMQLQRDQMIQMQQLFSSLVFNNGIQPQLNSLSGVSQAQCSFPKINNFEQSSIPASHSVKFLASQIPLFSGTEDEDIELWLEKLENVARIHNLSSAVLLSAATTKLDLSARRWFDLSPGETSESWDRFKIAILRRFKRKIPFSVLMQKVEARKWIFSKESFQDYAMDKLALIQRLKLPDEDAILLLINGISNLAMRATAAAIDTESLDIFLQRMQRLTASCDESLKKMSSSPKFEKSMESDVKSGKFKDSFSSQAISTSLQKEVKLNSCVYCHAKDHIRDDCPKLKKKEMLNKSSPSTRIAPVAAVDEYSEASSPVVAFANEVSNKIVSNSSTIKVDEVNGISSNLIALVDSGSPISFMCPSIFNKIFGSSSLLTVPSSQYKALDNGPIKVRGIISTSIKLEALPDTLLNGVFHVLQYKSSAHIILGCDFLKSNKILFMLNLSQNAFENKVHLLSHVASAEVLDCQSVMDNFLSDIEIDFDSNVKKQLVNLILEINNTSVPLSDDDEYLVKVNLKDDSIFAYAPRKFAYSERIQIRQIIDDLLVRGIIKISNSSYCARVVPVRKKNGSLRLCIDLRPLNNRVIKQKYPFPLIEDCLSRLGNKSIFTSLDLKDGFHHIKIHPDHTKYFSFATPDGQYEYLRLPFGFCEAPAEFQKRLVQVLQPLIREDKVIVYIDDILIPSESIEENLFVLKQVLLLLKRYQFQLNYKKCAFLKSSIEYLGYMISSEGISLSTRHVDAVKNFPLPKNLLDLQRFLGLSNYFRKFIKDYAIKAKPLTNLLKKDSTVFDFNENCIQAFDSLKQDLVVFPVLRLYNPHFPTEIHTDASSLAIAGILFQKQKSGDWAPVAYFSQSTNKAEANYHSFELEMLAIVRTIERFHIYLYGLEFSVVTDCNALVFAINKANLNPRIARWTLMLQNYRFKTVHREGRRMSHVDALSRVVNLVEAIPLDSELQYKQLQDDKLKEIARELEYKDNDKFVLIEGLVYKKFPDKPRFAVPDSMVFNIIRAYHDNLAHCGIEKVVQGISVNYWFPSLRKRVRDYVDNCLTCLMANVSSNSREGEMQISDTPSSPFIILHLDHFGPISDSSDGFKHILVIVDAFSRFTWLFAVKSTGSKEVVKHLSYLFNIFGNPVTIVSDRGTAFTSQEFAEFIKSKNIAHRLVAVAAPWANGLVERVNKFLKSSLKKVVEDYNWSTYLNSIQYVINNTHHSSLRASPSKLLFGVDQRNHADADLVSFLNNLAKISFNISEERDASRSLALDVADKIKSYNKNCYDEKHKKPSLYNAGDYVLIRDTSIKPGEDKKLKLCYKGPYMVSKVLKKNRYVIQDIPGFNINAKPYNSILSPDRMKPWIKPIDNPS